MEKLLFYEMREKEVTFLLSFKLYILLCLMRWWKRLAIQNFLREFLIENNFVTLSPYLGYHINLTRAGSATKKELICTHHEKAHKSVSFVSSYDERTNDFTLKAFNSYKLSSSRHQTTTIKKSRENEANFFISTKFNNGWISYHDTYLHLSLSSLHIHWYCSFSHSILMPVLFAWERDFFFALFVTEDDLLEWLWHVVIIMKKPHEISTLRCCRVNHLKGSGISLKSKKIV